MNRFLAAIYILFNGVEKFMGKKNKELPATFAKGTDNYSHFDIEGIVKEDLDLNSFKTVSMPNGNKLVTARNTKTGEIQGIRLLVKKGNPTLE